MSEPKKFQCQSERPSDFITVTDIERLNGARLKVAVTTDTLHAWVLLEPKRAREFAAEVVRLAAEIDATTTKKEEPAPMKKPFKFESRRVFGVPVSGDCVGLTFGPFMFPLSQLHAIRQALDDYEAAHEAANKLTFADLAIGEWFRWKDAGTACKKTGKESLFSSASNNDFSASAYMENEVIRLTAKFEDAQ